VTHILGDSKFAELQKKYALLITRPVTQVWAKLTINLKWNFVQLMW